MQKGLWVEQEIKQFCKTVCKEIDNFWDSDIIHLYLVIFDPLDLQNSIYINKKTYVKKLKKDIIYEFQKLKQTKKAICRFSANLIKHSNI